MPANVRDFNLAAERSCGGSSSTCRACSRGCRVAGIKLPANSSSRARITAQLWELQQHMQGEAAGGQQGGSSCQKLPGCWRTRTQTALTNATPPPLPAVVELPRSFQRYSGLSAEHDSTAGRPSDRCRCTTAARHSSQGHRSASVRGVPACQGEWVQGVGGGSGLVLPTLATGALIGSPTRAVAASLLLLLYCHPGLACIFATLAGGWNSSPS